MLDEEKQSEASTDSSESSEDVKETTEETESESDGAEKPAETTETDKTTIDYKAEALKYKRQAEERQKALERISKAKERKAQESTDSEDGEDTTDLDSKLDARVNSIKQELYADYIEDALDDVAESEDERELIKTIYDTRIGNKGFSKKQVLADMQDAKLLANRSRFESDIRAKTEAKVKKALAEDKAMSGTGAASGGRKPPASQSNLTAEERSFMDNIRDYKKRNGIK